MARYLCVVSRDRPLLAGYLLLALADDSSPREEIRREEIRVVLDRRREPPSFPSQPRGPGLERRQRPGVEATLRAQPFVFVPEPPPGLFRRAGMRAAALRLEGDRRGGVWRWRLALVLGVAGAAAVAGALLLWPLSDMVARSRVLVSARPPHGDDPAHRASRFAVIPDVELASRREGRGGGQSIVYTARLRGASGEPVAGAEVSLLAVLSDGTRREIPLAPVSPPGAYRGRLVVGARTAEDLRVHVALGGQRLEVPVPR